MKKLIIILTFLCVAIINYAQSPLATPNARGMGAYNKGGLGAEEDPIILYVDRLTDDSGNNGVDHGSFRWCVTRTYPRIIVFEVSGYISIESSLLITSPYMTIYGQTAPDPGITLTGNYYMDLRGSDYIIQHMRFRPSYDGTEQRDALSIGNAQNVFIDNCSFSYSIDELIGISGSIGDESKNITISDCILSWPIGYSSGKGILAGENTDSISYLRNAFIHCADRAPFHNGTNYNRVEVLNNITFNLAYFGIMFGAGESTAEISIIGNRYKYGLSTAGQADRQVVRLRSTMTTGVGVYLNNNYSAKRVSASSEWDGVVYYDDERDSTDYKVSSPFSWAITADWDYTQLEDSLSANAGARPWDRDLVDVDALNDMTSSTGVRIDDIADAYWPELDSFYLEVPIPDNPFTVTGNDFTNIENWAEYYQPNPVDDPCATTYINLSAQVTHTVGTDADGAIDLTVSGGLAPYEYLWSNSETTEDLTGLVAGDYFVTVTDDNNCTNNDTYTVIELSPCDTTTLVLTAKLSQIVGGGATGSIDLTVSGGLPPYEYLWSNSETTQDLSGLVAGNYSVTVTDANNCTNNAIYTLTNVYDYFMILDDELIILNDSVLIIKN